MRVIQMPSGSWMCQVQRNGVRRAFVAEKKSEAKNLAEAWIGEAKRTKKVGIDVHQAMLQYIEAKRNVLSPTTIAQYEKYAENAFPSLRTVPVSLLTSLDVQTAVNDETGREKQRGGRPVSAKFVKNEYAFLSAAIKLVRPDFALRVTLPKPTKTYRDLPTAEDVLTSVRGTDIELSALLAMWLSLTASEIRGIKVSSIKDNILTIDETVVQVKGKPVHKERGKAFDRNRRVRIPPYIMSLIEQTEAWKAGEGYIETRSGKAISSRFTRVTGGICRFHDLRHIFASVGLALNIPEKYLMEQGGWSTPATMKNVYQHTYEQERISHQDQIDRYFDALLQ